MPFVRREAWDRLHGQVLELTREVGTAKAEAERWRGMYEVATQQVAHAQDREAQARADATQARRASEEQDPWAEDPAELARLRVKMEQDAEATLLGEETGVRK